MFSVAEQSGKADPAILMEILIFRQHRNAGGLSGTRSSSEALANQGIQMIYDQTYQVLADGNYGLAVSEGSFGGAHTSYYDLFRVENGKIVEQLGCNGNYR